jgi:hypothetical protein
MSTMWSISVALLFDLIVQHLKFWLSYLVDLVDLVDLITCFWSHILPSNLCRQLQHK